MARKRKPDYTLVKNVIILLSGVAIGLIIYILIFPNQTTAPNSSKSGLNEINNKFSTGDFRVDQYYAFKIMAPKSYVASTDQMLGSYLTVGGMAPPRLFLNKNSQMYIDDNGDFLSKVWRYSENDCISIWTTGGLSSVKEWLDLPSLEIGKLGNKEEIKVGNRSAEIYSLSRSDGDVYVGFMPIESEFGISYFFRTCNANNKEELVDVIKSLKLRVDGGLR